MKINNWCAVEYYYFWFLFCALFYKYHEFIKYQRYVCNLHDLFQEISIKLQRFFFIFYWLTQYICIPLFHGSSVIQAASELTKNKQKIRNDSLNCQ